MKEIQMRKVTGKSALMLSLLFAFAVTGCATQNTSLGTKIDDSAITAKVKTALLADPGVSGQKVSVETVAGVVQLGGFATASEATKAVAIARRTEGVRSVENKISVR